MIILAFKLTSDAPEKSGREKVYQAARRTSINTLVWSEGIDVFVYESHLTAEEIAQRISNDKEAIAVLESCAIFDVKKFKSISTINIKTDKILRAYTDD